MWAAMAAVGAVATLVAIAASATLNYRYTFTMFGDDAVESYPMPWSRSVSIS
jgi:hypothetical protein